ncbi:hypothetical protein ASPVEDRAFT_156431 [Aspergillus versicolor CBS 583.65]|uniref:Uncharacterized protein n=1 Tax=Aspergillus versicolor CBS 583.65 TaxID=1036611 RepID=A0A1L9Q4X8_ASPVE|nr:uncharacterized protein ASPVEDRAFT_156431 [Aspergillus versicolor CBS 583.65]OJJ08835.1 hypothetical protein ASPVEDRAFT_156431 [Aspergillus versicolor CBS 583.65]
MPPSTTARRRAKQEPLDIKSEANTEEPVKEERPGSIGPTATGASPPEKRETVAIKPDSATQQRVQDGPVKQERPGAALWNIPEHDEHQTSNETDSSEPTSDRVEPWDSAAAGPLFLSRDAFKVGFRHLLDNVEATGPFCASQYVEAATPQRPYCAPAIENALSDGQMTESYELGQWQFFSENPGWRRQVSLFAKEGLTKLGISQPDDVLARPEKLIAFKEGSFFMPETRPCNELESQEHFGTLAICLPSRHEGGDLMVSHSGQVETIATSLESDFQFSYTIFSALGRIRGTRLTSGYRVVLLYRLLHGPSKKALLHGNLRTDSLAEAVTRWTMCAERQTDFLHGQGLPPSTWFSSVKDLHFTLNTLRPEDKVRMAKLRRICNAEGCLILLAFLRFLIPGSKQEGDDSFSRTVDYPNLSHPTVPDFYIHLAKDLDGNTVFRGAEGNPSLPAYDLQDGVEPIAENGSRGPAIHRHYVHTVALVVPKPFYAPLLLSTAKAGNLCNPREVLKDIYREYQACPEKQKLRSQVSELCEIMASQDIMTSQHRRLTRDALLDVAPIALEIGKFDVVVKCLDVLGHRSERLAGDIGKAIYTHGVQQMQPVLENLWKVQTRSRLDGMSTLAGIRRAWDNSAGEQHTPDEIHAWFSRTFNMLLTRTGLTPELREIDGQELAFGVGLLTKSFVEENAVPFVRVNGHYNGFVVSFLTMLFRLTPERDGHDLDFITSVYRSLLPTLLQHFSILNGPPDGLRHSTISPSELIKPKSVVNLIEQMNILNLDITPVLSILERSITEFHHRHGIFLFFLQPLIESLSCYLRPGDLASASPASTDSEDTNDEVIESPAQTDSKEAKFIVRILKNYIQSYVGPPPPPPKPGATLRHFVEDSHAFEQDFPMGAQRRKHLQGKLPRTFVTDTIRTGSPHTLYVRKTVEWYTPHQHNWRTRAAEVRGRLHSMELLSPLLNAIGEDVYDGLVLLCEPLPSPAPGQVTSTLASSASNALNEIQPNRQSNSGPRGSSSPASTVPQKREFTELD